MEPSAARENEAAETPAPGVDAPPLAAAGVGTAPLTRWQRVQAYRERHAGAEIALFFVAGFLFDVITLDRIDNWKNLLQQGGYLAVLGGLLLFEQRYRLVGDSPPRFLGFLTRFHEDAAHFLLGSLLSSFALFFFKSASGFSAFLFLLVIFALLLANELPRFRSRGPVIRYGLYSLALTSYFAYLLPVVFGRVGWYLFVAAAALSSLPFILLFKKAVRWSSDRQLALRQVAAPALGVQLALVGLYFAGAIPPVPLSIEKIGIYHEVKAVTPKDELGKPLPRVYELMHQRAAWRFWHRGDQHFVARKGDTVYAFVRIFVPMTVKGGNVPISFQWYYDDPVKGWVKRSSYTFKGIVGGRAEGYRTFATLSDPQPGDWRVEVLSPDGREIGSIGFTVERDEDTAPRNFIIEHG